MDIMLMVEKIIKDKRTEHLLDHLEQRWQDENEYEDWKDYFKRIKHNIEERYPDVIITKATKKPFGFCGTFNNKRFSIKMKINKQGFQLMGSA